MISCHSFSSGVGVGQLVDPHTIATSINSALRSDVLINLKGAPPYNGDGSCAGCIRLIISNRPFLVLAEGDEGIGGRCYAFRYRKAGVDRLAQNIAGRLPFGPRARLRMVPASAMREPVRSCAEAARSHGLTQAPFPHFTSGEFAC